MTQHGHRLGQELRISAVIAFGLPLHQVDDLVDEVAGTAADPGRWVVISADMNLLGTLSHVWQDRTEMVLCAAPSIDQDMVGAAVDMIGHEQIKLELSAWLQPADIAISPPPSVGLSMAVPQGLQFDAKVLCRSLRAWLATKN